MSTSALRSVTCSYLAVWDLTSDKNECSGVTSSGISFSALLLLLAVLNIPGVTSTTLKKRDRESGKAIETIASKTCTEACMEEVEKNEGNGGIRVSADAGWQTRSSGRKYNSFSGHSVLIGENTGKVLQHDVRCRKCRICYNAEKKGTTPASHDCRKNWDGSAKSMETDMIVGMIKNMNDKNISVSELVMDEDSTTIARAKKVCGEDLTKYSDRNHIKKTFTNKLYDLQRVKKYSQLRGKTIAHLKKCFSYALAQHQKNPEEMRKSLGAIVPHMYGDHSECRTWCKYRRNPDTYVPKNLPYSRYLTCEELKVDLENIISTYIQQVQKLSHLGSTQACESFNNCVAYKHPKTLFLSGSESTCFRVAAAVAQKNVGKSYVTEVNKKLSLSPGSQTQKVVERMDRKRALEKERYQSSKYKKRKFHLKKSSSQDQESKEVREGTTYETSVEIEQEENNQDIESIPPALPLPTRTPLMDDDYTWIFFDLETTGLGLTCEILEIGAARGNETFQRFIKPVGSISTKATLVHGIHLKKNTLMKRGEVLQTTDLQSALEDFSSWLSSSKNNVLLGHNGHNFDFPLLVKNLLYKNVSTNVVGFVDTLDVFRDILHQHTGSFSQESLMRECALESAGQAHCALYDSVNLQKLAKCHHIIDKSLIKHSVSFEYVCQNYSRRLCKEKNYKSLQVLVHQKVVSDFMANKIASSGLNFSHLKLAFQRHQEDGIRNLFIENVGGKVRVSKCKKIWSSVANYFSAKK